MVFAGIDLVMLAKDCSYAAAQTLLHRIMQDYYGLDAAVEGQADCLHFYRVRFPGQGQQLTVAFDVQQASQLLMLIPKCGFSAQKLKEASDVALRIEGGDLSLFDRIVANRKFQQYLAEHDPDHPLRSVGEYAEARQAEEEEAVPEAQLRRAELELELAVRQKRRLLDLDFEERQLELAAKKARLEQELKRMEHENAKVAAEAAAATQRARLEEERLRAENAAAVARQAVEAQRRQEELHEEFRRQRGSTIAANLQALRLLRPERAAPLSPRSMLAVEDELRTGLLGRERPDPELGRPLYCSQFLSEQLRLTDWAAKDRAKVFGNDVKEAVQRSFPEYDLRARTNRSVDAREREPRLYFEAHLPAFHEALRKYLARAAPVRDDELSRDGIAARRRDQDASRSSFFGRAPVAQEGGAREEVHEAAFEGAALLSAS